MVISTQLQAFMYINALLRTVMCFEMYNSINCIPYISHNIFIQSLVFKYCIMKSFQFIENYSDEAFLSNSRGILNNCLTNILHINKNETDVNVQQIRRRLSYYDFDQFTKLAKENKNS